LHIIKLTFNSLPGNQTSQFVDLKVLNTHSTLPPSTSSHFINFIPLYQLHPTPSTSSHFMNFIPLHDLRPTPSISSLYQLHPSSTLSLLNFITLTEPYHTPSRSLAITHSSGWPRQQPRPQFVNLKVVSFLAFTPLLTSPFSVNSHSHKRTTFHWPKPPLFCTQPQLQANDNLIGLRSTDLPLFHKLPQLTTTANSQLL
jgi:hypothetical protein